MDKLLGEDWEEVQRQFGGSSVSEQSALVLHMFMGRLPSLLF